MAISDEVDANIRALEAPCAREGLALAAIALATSDDTKGLAALRDRLRTNEFLRRLDNLDDPTARVQYLSRVFSALETHPSPGTLDLSIEVAESPEFTALPIRMNFLLPALGAVRPLTEGAAEIIRRTNGQGFYNVNAPILIRNGSPLALRLFEEMIRDTTVDAEMRIDALHSSVLTHRTDFAVLQMSANLIESGLDPAVRIGVVETIFDYRPGEWFGAVCVPPAPPPWDTAADDALEFALRLADLTLRFTDLPSGIRQSVERSVAEIRGILERRRQ